MKKEYIKDFNIKNLIPYEKNPRKNDEAVNSIIKSINRNGNIDPIEIDENNVILTGHTRLKAFNKLNIEKADVIRVTGLTEKQKKSYRIEHNKTNEVAEWDLELLHEEFTIDELEDFGFEIPEINIETEEKEIIEDEIPEIKKESIVKRGDVWLLGNHRLKCGDSTCVTDVEDLMDGKKADCVFTDPPYNTGMNKKSNSGSTWLSHMFNDSFTDEEWKNLLQGFTSILYSFMKEDSIAYICLDWRRNHELIPYIKNNFHLSNIIVWDKVVHGLGSDYKYTYELLNVCKKGKPTLNTHQGDQEYQDIWHIQRKIGKDEEHATKKPIELIARSLRHSSKKDDIILDIFGGSGSTLIACEQLNRRCYMMELDEHYCQVIIDRYINFKKNNGYDVYLLKDGTKISYEEIVNGR